ncbi:MAG: glycosyltransferase family 4 protein [Endozoicomonas sp.]
MKTVIVGTVANSLINFRASLILELARQGHEVFAFSVDYSDETKKEVRSLGAIPVDYGMSRTGMNPLSDFIQMLKLLVEIRRIKPDVCFCYFAKPVIFGTFAAWMAGVKRRFGMIEGLGYAFTAQPQGKSIKANALCWIQTFLYKMSIPLLNGVFFLNKDDVSDLVIKNRIKCKSIFILGGIGVNMDVHRYSDPVTSPIRFIFVGRLLVEKGIYEYLAAAEKVKNKYPGVEFIVLGGLDEGNPGGVSLCEIERLVAKGVIIFPGVVNDVNNWMKKSSVFVLPSYREGYPRSTQEAMSIGRPVITTSTPGCRETVIDGVNGFLVPPFSSDAIAERMEFFINNVSAIKGMSLKSREMALEQYDEVIVSRKVVKLIS